ncbi:hypothetical protein PF005_g32538 [Phytophthora fragariae]|uniref:Uncharacterized protein n=1 Tax=Phytophthora fragariae TaxID=53985 RepID=A0A6A3V190_9STRA|nr:hypothetical protein PF005_g32538 [Phytophthora fragariae]KAE9159635.1 hypothetical protein PF004_g31470 [Phytophthora fragariae]KAE9261863.1 hypothetical protein PF001_g32253 [Phytophthora fragariae]
MPWCLNTMSTNRRAVCLAVTSAGTAARCTQAEDQTQSPLRWTANTPTESVVT